MPAASNAYQFASLQSSLGMRPSVKGAKCLHLDSLTIRFCLDLGVKMVTITAPSRTCLPRLLALILLAVVGQFTLAKNLNLVTRTFLNNQELLDVTLQGNYAFVPGGLGGLNIVDISDPQQITIVGQYTASGCAWGRIYSWAVQNHIAYGTGRSCGVHIVNVSNPSNPMLVQVYQDPALLDASYEHPSLSDSLLFLARHQGGVEILSIANPQQPFQVATIPTTNAWATLPSGEILYVADGSAGVKIVDIADPYNPSILATLTTSGTAKDLDLMGNYLFVANGAKGIDMLDVSDPMNPMLVSNYHTSGYASRVAANDSLVAVSDWDDVEILNFSTGSLELYGYKNTGGRVMALNMDGSTVYSAEWMYFNVFEIESIPEPDVDYSRRKIAFPRVSSGSSSTQTFTMSNNGNQDLVLNLVQLDNPNFEVFYDNVVLPPGESQEITITYAPQDNDWMASLQFMTNDPDEPVTSIQLTGNFPYGPMVGDTAPYFNLSQVNGTGEFSLGDLSGHPAVIAFFTGW